MSRDELGMGDGHCRPDIGAVIVGMILDGASNISNIVKTILETFATVILWYNVPRKGKVYLCTMLHDKKTGRTT